MPSPSRRLRNRQTGRATLLVAVLPWAASALGGGLSMDALWMEHEALMEDVEVEGAAVVLARGVLSGGTSESSVFVERLRAQSRRSQGVVVSPVLDLGSALGAEALRSIEVTWFGDAPSGTEVRLALRNGRGPDPDPSAWTAWLALSALPGRPTRVAPAAGRYAQWRLDLASSSASVTPRVTRVVLRPLAAGGQIPDPRIRPETDRP